MNNPLKTFESVEELLTLTTPSEPVYCIYPGAAVENARSVVSGFPGRVLYAVKANDHPSVVRLLNKGGVKHFDCASLPEIEVINAICDEPCCYFMTPVRLRGAAGEAQSKYGVKHFLVDHLSGVEGLTAEIDMEASVVFARMAVTHDSAMINLSNRFGAPPDDIPQILEAIRDLRAEPALAFNVGSGVTSPAAYLHSIRIVKEVINKISFKIRLLDIGGGFPRSYPGFKVPPLNEYFDAIGDEIRNVPLAENAEILCEPGRVLAGPCMSAVVEVRLRKEARLFLNDGMYGIFWELRSKGHDRFPARAFREGNQLTGPTQLFRLFGPTCDSEDELPGEVELPADIRVGDYLEFGDIGAYSLSGRTNFNGFQSEQIVAVTGSDPLSSLYQ